MEGNTCVGQGNHLHVSLQNFISTLFLETERVKTSAAPGVSWSDIDLRLKRVWLGSGNDAGMSDLNLD